MALFRVAAPGGIQGGSISGTTGLFTGDVTIQGNVNVLGQLAFPNGGGSGPALDAMQVTSLQPNDPTSSSLGASLTPFSTSYVTTSTTDSLLPATESSAIGGPESYFSAAYVDSVNSSSVTTTTATTNSLVAQSETSAIGSSVAPFNQVFATTTTTDSLVPQSNSSSIGSTETPFYQVHADTIYASNIISTSTVEISSVAVDAPVLILGQGNGSDSWDGGILVEYTQSGSTGRAGLLRNHADGSFALYSSLSDSDTPSIDNGYTNGLTDTADDYLGTLIAGHFKTPSLDIGGNVIASTTLDHTLYFADCSLKRINELDCVTLNGTVVNAKHMAVATSTLSGTPLLTLSAFSPTNVALQVTSGTASFANGVSVSNGLAVDTLQTSSTSTFGDAVEIQSGGLLVDVGGIAVDAGGISIATDDLTVTTGNISAANGSVTASSIISTGSASVATTLQVDGALTASSTVDVTDLLSANGGFAVAGTTTLVAASTSDDALVVDTGCLRAYNNVFFGSATGNVYVDTSSQLIVGAVEGSVPATPGSYLLLQQNKITSDATNGLSLDGGDVSIVKNLSVTGTTSFTDTVTAHGDLYVYGTLHNMNPLTNTTETELTIINPFVLLSAAASSDVVDAGLLVQYGTTSYGGMVRRKLGGGFLLFDDLSSADPSTANFSLLGTDYTAAALQVGALTATSITATTPSYLSSSASEECALTLVASGGSTPIALSVSTGQCQLKEVVINHPSDGGGELFSVVANRDGSNNVVAGGQVVATAPLTALASLAVGVAVGETPPPFMVDGSSGNTVIAGTLEVYGLPFSVDASGNVSQQGTLTVASSESTYASLNPSAVLQGVYDGTIGYVLTASTGNMSMIGNLCVGDSTDATEAIQVVGSGGNSFQVSSDGNVRVGSNFTVASMTDGNGLFNVNPTDGTAIVGSSSTATLTMAPATGFSMTASGGSSSIYSVDFSGNVASAGSLSAANGVFDVDGDGNVAVATTKFTVGASTGNVASAGSLSAANGTFAVDGSGNVAIATNKFTVHASNGNVASAGSLSAAGGTFAVDGSGNVAVATNKFTVGASTGNVASVGSLSAANGTFAVDGSGNVAVATDKFTVDATSGNVVTAGSLSANTLAIHSTALTVDTSGNLTAAGAAQVGSLVLKNTFSTTTVSAASDGTFGAGAGVLSVSPTTGLSVTGPASSATIAATITNAATGGTSAALSVVDQATSGTSTALKVTGNSTNAKTAITVVGGTPTNSVGCSIGMHVDSDVAIAITKGSFDQSASSGSFSTGSGAVALNGATTVNANLTIANGNSLAFASGATLDVTNATLVGLSSGSNLFSTSDTSISYGVQGGLTSTPNAAITGSSSNGLANSTLCGVGSISMRISTSGFAVSFHLSLDNNIFYLWKLTSGTWTFVTSYTTNSTRLLYALDVDGDHVVLAASDPNTIQDMYIEHWKWNGSALVYNTNVMYDNSNHLQANYYGSLRVCALSATNVIVIANLPTEPSGGGTSLFVTVKVYEWTSTGGWSTIQSSLATGYVAQLANGTYSPAGYGIASVDIQSNPLECLVHWWNPNNSNAYTYVYPITGSAGSHSVGGTSVLLSETTGSGYNFYGSCVALDGIYIHVMCPSSQYCIVSYVWNGSSYVQAGTINYDGSNLSGSPDLSVRSNIALGYNTLSFVTSPTTHHLLTYTMSKTTSAVTFTLASTITLPADSSRTPIATFNGGGAAVEYVATPRYNTTTMIPSWYFYTRQPTAGTIPYNEASATNIAVDGHLRVTDGHLLRFGKMSMAQYQALGNLDDFCIFACTDDNGVYIVFPGGILYKLASVPLHP